MSVAATQTPVPAVGGGAPAGQGPADEVLVRRLRGGEAAAGETLVRRYQAPLLRYLRRLSGDEHVAEELLQATWLSVLEHLDRFDASTSAAPGGFKAWIFRIATNKANDVWRSRGREDAAIQGMRLISSSHAPQAPRVPQAQHAPDAARSLDASEQRTKLLRAIEQLPESQRQVLTLRYYAEMKFVEIAQTLGCPLNTALGRMHKAMVKLKQVMQD
jgi:RNA polymerase sigma-70 factor (ECF subfamily)